jgi:hypothetical protein
MSRAPRAPGGHVGAGGPPRPPRRPGRPSIAPPQNNGLFNRPSRQRLTSCRRAGPRGPAREIAAMARLDRLTLVLRPRDTGSGPRPHRPGPRAATHPSRPRRRIGTGRYMAACNLACSGPKYPTVLLWSFFHPLLTVCLKVAISGGGGARTAAIFSTQPLPAVANKICPAAQRFSRGARGPGQWPRRPGSSVSGGRDRERPARDRSLGVVGWPGRGEVDAVSAAVRGSGCPPFARSAL